jgi:hypothetical protein
MIDRACFEEATNTLMLSFRSADKYVYYDVPLSIFETLCKAPSAGRFVNACIKGNYRCRRDPERRRFGPNANAYM